MEVSYLQLGWCITAAYVVVILFGAFGNMLTIIAVLYNPQIRTTRNFFILNLALSDFFICTIAAPITSYTVRINLFHFPHLQFYYLQNCFVIPILKYILESHLIALIIKHLLKIPSSNTNDWKKKYEVKKKSHIIQLTWFSFYLTSKS